MLKYLCIIPATVFSIATLCGSVTAQSISREVSVKSGGTVEVVNRYGRVDISADGSSTSRVKLTATSPTSVRLGELDIKGEGSDARIEVTPSSPQKRVDISLTVPERVKLKIETAEGEVRVTGDLELVQVGTGTGTIAVDVPVKDLRYELLWTQSRPRILADFEIAKIKEKAAGKFEIKGKFSDQEPLKANEPGGESTDEARKSGVRPGEEGADEPEKKENGKRKKNAGRVTLNFSTARGIVLLNVPPNEVMSDLRERPLTNAAKAVIRSGNSVLTEAIRRASPKYFGEYERTLGPTKFEPTLTEVRGTTSSTASIKQATIRVTDSFNRAVPGLRSADFEITENGSTREVLDVKPATAPVNLVLLIDVSGSVDNYVNFIRKAARSFVETIDRNDRISIVLFNDDVKVLSGFTTDRQKLSESLDTFDAGGGTAFYDAIAYTLADTLRPISGERTAIVVLTDGDDNRSFLPFDSLLGSIEESGALIYPLYVPSTLVAASDGDIEKEIDPLRARYMTLSKKAEGEGEKLAKISGGVYYPITQLSQIRTAYEDIAAQLRTAYSVTFRSAVGSDPAGRTSPRLKARVKRANAFAQIGPVIKLSDDK